MLLLLKKLFVDGGYRGPQFATAMTRILRIFASRSSSDPTPTSTGATWSERLDPAYEMRDHLLAGELDVFGQALRRGWEMKRGLSDQISTSAIDQH
jgi:hypothetical protein